MFVHLTADTWAVVASTVGAAFLGAIVAYIGSALQQRRQDERVTRVRIERGVAELLSAAFDILMGVRAIREAHSMRTKPRYYLNAAGVLLTAMPELTSLSVLTEYETMRPMVRSALDLLRERTESSRVVALDVASVVVPKLSAFFALAAMLTLGEDKEIAEAVREFSPKVTAVAEAAGARKREFDRLSNDMQMAMEEFRAVADKHVGNVKRRRLRLKSARRGD